MSAWWPRQGVLLEVFSRTECWDGTPAGAILVGSTDPVRQGCRMTPYRFDRGEGESLWMFDSLDTIKASAAQTGGAFTLVEFREFEGSAVPVHVNERSDTGFYVLEGEFDVVVGEERLRVAAGSWLFVPRGTGHGWRCRAAEGRVLYLSVPGGRDAFYREVGEVVPAGAPLPPRQEPDVGALADTAARHGIRIVGPPPEV